MRIMAMKKASRRKFMSIRGRPRALSDDACPVCGTIMIEKRSSLRLPINGEETAVPSALHLSCPRCGEIVLRLGDSRRLYEDAIANYRKKHHLLATDEIRALREHLG